MIAQVEIKQSCRDLHGESEAFNLAIEHIRKSYEMFMSASKERSFTIQLHLAKSTRSSLELFIRWCLENDKIKFLDTYYSDMEDVNTTEDIGVKIIEEYIDQCATSVKDGEE